jgi:hypothetical protein
MAQYAPTDPHYEETVDERTGKVKRTKVSKDHYQTDRTAEGPRWPFEERRARVEKDPA